MKHAKALAQVASKGEEVGKKTPLDSNIVVLRQNGIKTLFHFTDASNLDSIREHGLLAWKKIETDKIECKMNSSALSHRLDAAKGLSDYIRLSFCRKHPMMFKALKEARISRPVILEMKLEIVSRPGVLFCERNAAATGVQTSANPKVIHFEVVKKDYKFVSSEQKMFYQGEVLVPDYVPPHLIRFPKVDVFNRSLTATELDGRLPNATGAECSASGCEIGDRVSQHRRDIVAGRAGDLSCELFNKRKSDECSSAEPCLEGGSGTKKYNAPLESSTPDPTAVVEKVETHSREEVLTCLSDGGVIKQLAENPAVHRAEHFAKEVESSHEIIVSESVEKTEARELKEDTSVPPVGACETAPAEAKLETKLPAVLSPKGIGGVVAVKADGHCCYHLAGIFALLCRNPNALSHGVARCLPTDLTRAREQILQNFRSWLSESSKLSTEQLEARVKETTGDFIANFETRTCGQAVGEARLDRTLTLLFSLVVKTFELLSCAQISSCVVPREKVI